MRIAVAGGTGTIGKHLVAEARGRGHEVVVLSRSAGVDVSTGARVEQAVAGCEVVVDALNTRAQTAGAATRFFTAAAHALHREGRRAGVARVVVISIVGLEAAQGSLPYYRAKLAHEDAHRRGGLPLTVARSTQFHDFPGQILDRMSLGPVAAVPRMTVQPVDPSAVAGFVLDSMAQGQPEPMIQVGGPLAEDLVDLARRLLVHRGRVPRVTGISLPGTAWRALREGALLPGPDATLTGPSFADWLAAAAR